MKLYSARNQKNLTFFSNHDFVYLPEMLVVKCRSGPLLTNSSFTKSYSRNHGQNYSHPYAHYPNTRHVTIPSEGFTIK